MSASEHERAKELLLQRRVEALPRENEHWLREHLAQCDACAASDAQMSEALGAFRGLHIEMPRNLASRAQLRVRLRAEELREHGPANRLIWAVALLSWIFGIASAPLVWRGFAWLGGEFGLPKFVWVAGVALWWIVPALVATGVVLLEQGRRASASE